MYMLQCTSISLSLHLNLDLQCQLDSTHSIDLLKRNQTARRPPSEKIPTHLMLFHACLNAT